MTIRLLCTQIPKFWDLIKYAMQQVERIGVDNDERFNELLAQLLSDKAQCFVKYLGEEVAAVMITEVHEEKISLKRTLFIRLLFAFKLMGNSMDWQSDFSLLKDLAKKEKCSEIAFESNNSRVVDIGKSVGFTQAHIRMKLLVEG